jgi:hypothetical protein
MTILSASSSACPNGWVVASGAVAAMSWGNTQRAWSGGREGLAGCGRKEWIAGARMKMAGKGTSGSGSSGIRTGVSKDSSWPGMGRT